MVEAGHVTNVLVWRLDRLSRNLGDLILLADKFGQAGCRFTPSPRSSTCLLLRAGCFTTSSDLSLSSTGSNFLRTYRMGTQQAAKQGRWTNRPKTGYDLIAGELIPNADADRVRQVFRLRAEGMSHRQIEERTGIKRSTAIAILKSRIYLGEVVNNDTWYPGNHEPIITSAEFEAAHRGRVPGRRRGRDVLSGKVRCGLCSKLMAVEILSDGRCLYRCWHRGAGCRQPRRTNTGLHRAAVLALRLLGGDERLQEAIRRQLSGAAGREAAPSRRRARQHPGEALAALSERRRKLVELYYREQISAEGFAEEEQRLMDQIQAVRGRCFRGSTAGLGVGVSVGAFRGCRRGLAESGHLQRVAASNGGGAPSAGGRNGRRGRGLPRSFGGEGGRCTSHQRHVGRGGAEGVGERWCRRGDLNPYALAGTSPSSSRVCLFRHSDERPGASAPALSASPAPPEGRPPWRWPEGGRGRRRAHRRTFHRGPVLPDRRMTHDRRATIRAGSARRRGAASASTSTATGRSGGSGERLRHRQLLHGLRELRVDLRVVEARPVLGGRPPGHGRRRGEHAVHGTRKGPGVDGHEGEIERARRAARCRQLGDRHRVGVTSMPAALAAPPRWAPPPPTTGRRSPTRA